MLNAFSHELVNIKKDFETRLTESIQSITDNFLAGSFQNNFFPINFFSKNKFTGKKQELRRIDAEIINLEEREISPGKQTDYANRLIAILRRKIEIHEKADRKIGLELLKMVAQLEEEIGDQLIALFRDFIRDLDGQSNTLIINQFQNNVTRSENNRNRASKSILDKIEQARREFEKINSNNSNVKSEDTVQQFLSQMKFLVPESLLSEAIRSAARTSKQDNDKEEHSWSWISFKQLEKYITRFDNIGKERQEVCSGGSLMKMENELILQEKKYISTFQDLEINQKQDLTLQSTNTQLDKIKQNIAESLFSQKFQVGNFIIWPIFYGF